MSAPGRGSCTWRPSQVVAPGKQSGTRWWAARGTGPGVRGHRHGGSQVPDEEKEDDPPPQAAAPRCTSAQLTDHLEDYGAPPPSGKDRGVLGGCPGGSRRAHNPGERESPRRWRTPREARPSGILLPRSSWITIGIGSTPPWGTGQQDEQPETQFSRLSETRPAVQVYKCRFQCRQTRRRNNYGRIDFLYR